MRYKLGVIGGGNMAEAIVRGGLGGGELSSDAVIVSDPVEGRRGVFEAMGVDVTDDNSLVVSEAEQIMLAVKPQMIGEVMRELCGIDVENQGVISIMGGIGTEKLAAVIGGKARVVRVMPNTPVLVGRGMSGVALGSYAREGDEALAMGLLSAGGEAVLLDEKYMDAVGAVSGSGPAYVFYLAEAMMKAADELGLPHELIDLFVVQTILGAGELMNESDVGAGELRRRVMSKGGTTEAAIESMDEDGVGDEVVAAIGKAYERSIELGR